MGIPSLIYVIGACTRCTFFSVAEIRTLVGSVKDMIESQKHVGPPVAFTGFLYRLSNLTNMWVRDIWFFQVQCSTRWTTVGKYANQFCNIYYANVNGFRSKSESIKQLIQENGTDILVLTETKVYNKSTTR